MKPKKPATKSTKAASNGSVVVYIRFNAATHQWLSELAGRYRMPFAAALHFVLERARERKAID